MNPTCLHCSSPDTVWKPKAGKWECHVCEERFEGEAPSGGASTPAPLSAKADKPKRIFFSYGHDANRELVDRFKADLEDRGHEVWIDYKEIGSWDDWKGAITRGIHDSQLAIAFLSIHSTRDPGVCRNEVAMALQHFGKVYPVLVEEVPQESIPVTIAHLQWPDLSQWQIIRDSGVDGADFERYYEEKLLEIVSRVEGDATRLASEAAILRRVLKPSSFEGKFAQHLEGFMGREWIFDAFEDWLNQQPNSRVFWLKAGPGFGKTALAVNLASRYRAAVVGTWFCDEQSIELRDPLRAVCTLAFQLALRWDDYRARLLPRLDLFAGSPEAQIAESLESLSKKNLADLFNHLISDPLAGLIWREHKLVILIDALDEATEATGQNALSALISCKFLELPKWISFVVTSRPDASVVGHLQRFKPFEIAAADARNTNDLARYCAARIGGSPELAGLDAAVRDQLRLRLVEKSEGMILYLRMVEEGLMEGTLQVDDLERMQTGLGGLYSRYYQTFEHRFGCDFATTVRPLLGLIMAAPGPLPLDLATEVLGIEKEATRKMRMLLGGYLSEAPQGLSLFHKTLSEWLGSDASGPYLIDVEVCVKQIGDFLWECFLRRKIDAYGITLPLEWEEQVLEWLPNMLSKIIQWNQAKDLAQVAEWLSTRQQWKSALYALQRALYHHETIMGEFHPETLITRNRLGDLLRDSGDYSAAEKSYRYVWESCEKHLESEHPVTLECQKNMGRILRDLGRIDEAEALLRRAFNGYLKVFGEGAVETWESAFYLATTLRLLGLHDEAEVWYRASLEGRSRAFGADHPETLISVNGLGVLLRDKGDDEGAEVMYRRALDSREKSLGPSHPHTLQSVSNFAVMLSDKGDKEEAESMLRRVLKWRENALGLDHPDTLSSIYSLSILLGDKGDYEGAESALRRVLEGRENALGPDHPNTLYSAINLGLLLSDNRDYKEAELMYRRASEGLIKTRGMDDPVTRSSINLLACLLRAKGDYDEAEEIYRDVLEWNENAFGLEHPETIDSMADLGLLLVGKGDYTQAKTLWSSVLKWRENFIGREHPDTLNVIENLVGLLEIMGDVDESAALQLRLPFAST